MYTTNYATQQGFIVDPNSLAQINGVSIDWDLVTDAYRVGAFVVKLAAAVAEAATSATVDALPKAVKKGTVLRFAAGQYLELTADAAAGATTLAVSAALAAIADNSEAVVGGDGIKLIKPGTIMARLSSGLAIPRALSGATTATCILLTSADDKSEKQQGHGALVGGVIYANLLPDYAHADFATWKTELNAVSTGFSWQTFSNTMTA